MRKLGEHAVSPGPPVGRSGSACAFAGPTLEPDVDDVYRHVNVSDGRTRKRAENIARDPNAANPRECISLRWHGDDKGARDWRTPRTQDGNVFRDLMLAIRPVGADVGGSTNRLVPNAPEAQARAHGTADHDAEHRPGRISRAQ